MTIAANIGIKSPLSPKVWATHFPPSAPRSQRAERLSATAFVGVEQSGQLASLISWRPQVRTLHRPLKTKGTEGLPDGRRDPLGKRASDEPCGFDSRPFRCGAGRWIDDSSMVSVV